jgi:hypothetical protein
MSDAVWVAIIGVTGTLIGAVTTVLVARIQASHKARDLAAAAANEGAQTTPVLGELIEIRELRILRALFGEPKGRILEGYKVVYYRAALDAVVKKGWVKKIEGRFYMTGRGAEFCRTYLKQVLDTWQPANQVLT